MKPVTVELFNRQQAHAILKSTVYPYLAQHLQDGTRLVMTVGPRKRTKPQNRRYWSRGVLAQIAEQATVGGKLFSAEVWHELAKRKFVGFDELPNGEIIGKSTTGLSTAEFCDFCTQVEAWAASELGVTFYDLEPNQ
jgi:hypothetical protein